MAGSRPASLCARAAAGRGQLGRVQDSLPVLSTFCSSVLALFTVAVKLAPFMSAFIIVGMIASVASAVAQFLEFSGEIWVKAAALAKPAMTGLMAYLPPDSCEVNSGKKPCALANVVALDGLSITVTRSHAAVLFALLAQTPRSDP